MEISKVLTLSTAHISQKSAELLDKETEKPTLDLPIYNKSNYGWFIYIPQDINIINNLPEDIHRLLLIAKDLNCDILCLDADGETISWIPLYSW